MKWLNTLSGFLYGGIIGCSIGGIWLGDEKDKFIFIIIIFFTIILTRLYLYPEDK